MLSNSWSYFEEKARRAIEEELKMELPGGKVNINGKYKNFDLVNSQKKVVGDVKHYKTTSGGNRPSAKFSTLNEYVWLMQLLEQFDGSKWKKLFIIGEGPGQKEDELGKPFVGDAGNLLNKMLKAINIERDKIYITNVVNYRPPNNRKPKPNEINRYAEFLKEHISIIDPKILILMGSTAMEAILGSNKRISKERGIWKEVIIKKKSYKTIVTFHPAYLLRKPDQKKFSWEDLKNYS